MSNFKKEVITKKDTKDVILDYLHRVEEALDNAQKGKFNPEEIKAKEVIKENSDKAEKIVSRNILSEEIIDEFKALKLDIENKKQELQMLCDIEIKVGTLAALIEANNLEKQDFLNAKNELLEEKRIEIKTLEDEYSNLKLTLEKEYQTQKNELNIQRKREQEEYTYNITRERKIANDIWNDNKTKAEAEIQDKKECLKNKEIELEKREEELDELIRKVEEIPSLIDAAKELAYSTGKSEAEKIYAISKNSMTKELKIDNQILQEKYNALEANYEKLEAQYAQATEKLEDAYAKMNELATKTVQAQSSKPIYVDSKEK